eukprot:4859849-Prorocentrum_lima.AAC.1
MFIPHSQQTCDGEHPVQCVDLGCAHELQCHAPSDVNGNDESCCACVSAVKAQDGQAGGGAVHHNEDNYYKEE